MISNLKLSFFHIFFLFASSLGVAQMINPMSINLEDFQQTKSPEMDSHLVSKLLKLDIRSTEKYTKTEVNYLMYKKDALHGIGHTNDMGRSVENAFHFTNLPLDTILERIDKIKAGAPLTLAKFKEGFNVPAEFSQSKFRRVQFRLLAIDPDRNELTPLLVILYFDTSETGKIEEASAVICFYRTGRPFTLKGLR